MKYLKFIIIPFLLTSCYKGKKVDLIIHNGQIHIMNESLEMAEAMAIQDGKIIEVGPQRQIMNKYRANRVIDAELKDVFPGFHDAHGHIMSLAKQSLTIDLRKTRSYYEMISMIEKHQAKTNQTILIGRGWDQSIWGDEYLPNDSLLNEYFPNTPIALTRIDGHAMLVNQAMRDFVGITDSTKIDGGQIMKENGKLTGILLDHALDLVNNQIPEYDEKLIKEAILEIQDQLLAAGITHVHEAGLTAKERDIFIDLADENKLKINVYAMLFPSEENIKFAEKNGHYTNNHLSIRSFKVISDGALGSYGACLIEPYSDKLETQGILLKTPEELQRIAAIAKSLNYQLNTHCIGDSANRVLANIIDTLMQGEKDHRWRIEHAQVIHPSDFKLFNQANIIPSVQPTHATSDQRWAQSRLGENRLQHGAYAYKTLQEEAGMILFGTDFPIEDYDPFKTIHSAVQRTNEENTPIGGFLPNEAVSLDIALKAMTTWASYGCFEETRVGTIERNKKATVVIFDQPVKSFTQFLPNYAKYTIVDGNVVYEMP